MKTRDQALKPLTLSARWRETEGLAELFPALYTRMGMVFFLSMGYGIGAINGPGTKGPAEGMKE